jgi:thioredoxin-dependent peroxiredoxin
MSSRQGMKVGDREHPIQKEMLKVGDKAPTWAMTANNNSVKTSNEFAGKIKILSVVPSLDTRVCATQTRRFNEEAANLNENIVVITVSADLPFAQRRWCGAEGIERIVTLSCHRDMSFADDYGVHDTEWRICQRAVFVVDKDDVIRHIEYVYNMGSEPDYIAALSAAQKLV